VAYDVEAVKEQWEGYETPLRWGRYPVEHEPIRRHCQMLDDMNPRFLEDGHCPPVMVRKKDPDGRVDLELWIENAGEVTVPGTASVILPVRF
jgi:hypothetical protein